MSARCDYLAFGDQLGPYPSWMLNKTADYGYRSLSMSHESREDTGLV
jgi:hypothetical protein